MTNDFIICIDERNSLNRKGPQPVYKGNAILSGFSQNLERKWVFYNHTFA
ncbi:hypothetical protein ADICYQ_1365 [Cyclobacterium qasimii M12-11B]|uniref:Uncharacterized protein n=1 Tax=Cyclobacterium qasimii M12-11B TaxID=641524 RepID=S7VH78_9BACT|nr:hypothetical protein ADICYQ_1365 [Cyclobacterium qasimii M12-11B]